MMPIAYKSPRECNFFSSSRSSHILSNHVHAWSFCAAGLCTCMVFRYLHLSLFLYNLFPQWKMQVDQSKTHDLENERCLYIN